MINTSISPDRSFLFGSSECHSIYWLSHSIWRLLRRTPLHILKLHILGTRVTELFFKPYHGLSKFPLRKITVSSHSFFNTFVLNSLLGSQPISFTAALPTAVHILLLEALFSWISALLASQLNFHLLLVSLPCNSFSFKYLSNMSTSLCPPLKTPQTKLLSPRPCSRMHSFMPLSHCKRSSECEMRMWSWHDDFVPCPHYHELFENRMSIYICLSLRLPWHVPTNRISTS